MAQACPVALRTIDQNIVRLNAGQIAIWLFGFLITHSWIIPVFLAYDFAVRLARKPAFSPLNQISLLVKKSFSIPADPADEAPKRFAATLGLLFSLTTAVLAVFGFGFSAILVAVLFASCAFIESVFGFCVGCFVYQILQKFVK